MCTLYRDQWRQRRWWLPISTSSVGYNESYFDDIATVFLDKFHDLANRESPAFDQHAFFLIVFLQQRVQHVPAAISGGTEARGTLGSLPPQGNSTYGVANQGCCSVASDARVFKAIRLIWHVVN